MIAKLRADDIEKLMKVLRACRLATYVQISIDGPKVNFSFPDDAGKLLTVTLFDDTMSVRPTVTRTESI